MMPMQTRTLLKDVRKNRGLSVAGLAKRVGVSRQSIYAIEDDSFVPNTSVALRLAHVLEVSVEDLFALDEPSGAETVDAELLTGKSGDLKKGQLVRLCRVNQRLIAAPVSSFPAYLPAADGIVCGKSRSTVSVKSVHNLEQDPKRILLAGCDPALSLPTEMLTGSGMEIIPVPCSSRRALEYLKQGRVHVAGSHLRDPATGDYNVPVIKRLFPQGGVRTVTFAVWEQGLVLGAGNPKGIRSMADLANKRAILINREKGSGSRDLLDTGLRKAGITVKHVVGYENTASGHLSAAYAVATGAADCCIANGSAARCFGLEFIPLAVERFDLTYANGPIQLPAAKALLNLLNSLKLRRKLQSFAGYDTTQTGDLRI